jgi:thiamine pyrophosphokinase
MKQAFVFVNGRANDGEMVQRALADTQTPLVVAVDGGVRIAQHFKLNVDILVGDMDSLSADEYQAVVASGAEIHRHPPEKDYTDLELALMLLAERGYNWMRVIGGIGGRLDQTLANIYLLALPQLENCDIRIVANNQETYLLSAGKHHIHGNKDDTISLIPLGGAVHGIHTENLYYPLTNETLNFGPARGISNVMTADTATIHIKSGTLLLIHTLGRA